MDDLPEIWLPWVGEAGPCQGIAILKELCAGLARTNFENTEA